MVRRKLLRVARDKPPDLAPAIRTRERLLGGLPGFKGVLRGSLVTRYRCGVKTCHCAVEEDPGHGPDYYLMVTVGTGNALQVYVSKKHKEQSLESWRNED